MSSAVEFARNHAGHGHNHLGGGHEHAHGQQQHHSFTARDLSLLKMLTSDSPEASSSRQQSLKSMLSPAKSVSKKSQLDRRPPVDPLMLAAASAAGPDVTRNHYLHEFFPHRQAYASCDAEHIPYQPSRSKMMSQQAPRRQRLASTGAVVGIVPSLGSSASLSQPLPQGIPTQDPVPLKSKMTEFDKDDVSTTSSLAPSVKGDTQQSWSSTEERNPSSIPIKGDFNKADHGSPPPLPRHSLDRTSSTTPTPSPYPIPIPKRRRPSVADPSVRLLRSQTPGSSLHSPSTSPTRTTTSTTAASRSMTFNDTVAAHKKIDTPPPLVVRCQVRTRIPTPHGHIFLYLYVNNHDSKEHLAFVADSAQMNATTQGNDLGPQNQPFLRSSTLDQEWRDGETTMERIVRGAYIGKLSPDSITPSIPGPPPSYSELPKGASSTATNSQALQNGTTQSAILNSGEKGRGEDREEGEQDQEHEPPLVRIHSECFTGETIGSQRCDCGEQLDEAFRLITQVGRGIVVYLRQEGRGIGLLEKMRAYNLQDLGHDTVTANLMLGHGADLRTYDIAGAILRDLQVQQVRLLTNNPDKIEQIEKEGITVVERVAMVPRTWQAPARRREKSSSSGAVGQGGKYKRNGTGNGNVRKNITRRSKPSILSGSALLALAQESLMSASENEVGFSSTGDEGTDDEEEVETASAEDDEEDDAREEDDYDYESDESHNLRRSGVGMIGASITRSAELDKYLRTKVERMGHMLSLPTTPPSSRAESPHLPVRKTSVKRASIKRPSSSSKSSQLNGAQSPQIPVKKHGDEHPLASSIVSLDEAEGENSNCEPGCQECAAGDVADAGEGGSGSGNGSGSGSGSGLEE